MKIKFKEGGEVIFDIRYEYSAADRNAINHLVHVKDGLIQTRDSLKSLHGIQLNDGNVEAAKHTEELVNFIASEIHAVVCEIGTLKQFIVKTHGTLTYNGHEYTAFSSISKEDAKCFAHSRKIARKVTFAKLYNRFCSLEHSKEKRREVFEKLGLRHEK